MKQLPFDWLSYERLREEARGIQNIEKAIEGQRKIHSGNIYVSLCISIYDVDLGCMDEYHYYQFNLFSIGSIDII